MSAPSFNRFDDFYACYLATHSHVWNRRIHLAGWVLVSNASKDGTLGR